MSKMGNKILAQISTPLETLGLTRAQLNAAGHYSATTPSLAKKSIFFFKEVPVLKLMKITRQEKRLQYETSSSRTMYNSSL
jgi:hypothetical protein